MGPRPSPPWLWAAPNYLDSTKQGGETTNWSTWNGYAPYQLYDYNGVTVAVMGIGNPNIPKWDVPANWEGIYFANVIETYKHYEQEMTEKADLIVLASHSGIDSDAQSDFIRRLVSETNSIDLVFSGHEHRNGITQIANSDGQGNPRVLPVHQGSCGGPGHCDRGQGHRRIHPDHRKRPHVLPG